MKSPKYLFYILIFFSCSLNAQIDTLIDNKEKSILNIQPVVKSKLHIDTTNKISASGFNLPKTDSLKIKKGLLKDSLLKKDNLLKKIKSNIPSGNISFGYDYGFLPYTSNTTLPAQAFKTEGQVGLNLLNIPLNVVFFYTTQKNLIGLNNYFRVSYDADRYKEKISTKLKDNVTGYKKNIGDLQAQKQQLMQKMAYSDYLSSVDPAKWPSATDVPNANALPADIAVDTTSYKDKYSMPDTSLQGNMNRPEINSYIKTTKADSLKQIQQNYKYRSDSVKAVYSKYKEQYTVINDSIKKTQQKVEELENIINGNYSAYASKIPYIGKIQNFITGIKRLEIGLCYPDYSMFLAGNIPVRGINMEYSKNSKFFAFTYGTTVSTLLSNTRNPEGFLNNVRNSYNYFDFNNVSAGRKIVAAKFGIGSKEGNHVFLGFLIGKGQASYISSENETSALATTQSNLVLEADVKYKVGKNTAFDIFLGKSSVKEENLSYEVLRSSFNELFSDYRSYAFFTRISTKIKPTKTLVSVSARWVDPFFKSFGIGFLRSDNMRYELKLDQPLTKKLRYTAMFRYEEDNLLQLMNYKNRFYSLNNTLSLRPNRKLMIRLSYTPLVRTLTSYGYSIKNNNSISTGVITYTPKTRKIASQFSLLYNYYIINTDSQRVNFQNLAYNHNISMKNGFKTGFNVSWFKNTLTDTLNSNVFFGVLDVGYQFKNGSFVTVAGKSAYKPSDQMYFGYMLRTNVKLYKTIYWENQAEKLIVGDLFNGYELESLKKFPYYLSTRIILNF